MLCIFTVKKIKILFVSFYPILALSSTGFAFFFPDFTAFLGPLGGIPHFVGWVVS